MMKKLLIVILLITGCDNSDAIKLKIANYHKIQAQQKLKTDSILEIRKLKTDSILKSDRQSVDDFLKWHVNYINYHNEAQICEIRYLTTEDDKFRIEGNKCYDSARKYAILLNKKLKE